jgi:hypothetical protein
VALGWVHRSVGEEADGGPLAIAVLGRGWRGRSSHGYFQEWSQGGLDLVREYHGQKGLSFGALIDGEDQATGGQFLGGGGRVFPGSHGAVVAPAFVGADGTETALLSGYWQRTGQWEARSKR